MLGICAADLSAGHGKLKGSKEYLYTLNHVQEEFCSSLFVGGTPIWAPTRCIGAPGMEWSSQPCPMLHHQQLMQICGMAMALHITSKGRDA